jgi:hypothetical protein
MSDRLVQINVGRDLHIHGGCSGHVDNPCVHGAGPQWGALLGTLAYNGWRLVLGLALLCILLVVTVGAIGFYLLARVANAVLFVEQALGGAPTRIIAAPARMLPMLGVGGHIDELEGLNQLESDYAE